MPSPESQRIRHLLKADSLGSRSEQQDAAVVLESKERGTALLLVSDGVGGNSGGRIASQTVAEMARKLWEERKGELGDPRTDLGMLCSVAHQKINEEGTQRGITPRATIAVLYLTPAQAFWAHSGDSRLYHFRNGKLVERTADHSLVQVMVNQGMVKDEEMGRHPDQGTLLQSLGGEEYKEPTHGNAAIGPEDGFMLCTDGFWERTSEEEMAVLVHGPAEEAQRSLQAAVETAVKRNGSKSDNVTAALASSAMPAATAPEAHPHSFPETPAHAPISRKGGPAVIALVVVAVLLGLAAAFLLWNYLNKPAAPSQTRLPVPAGANANDVIPANQRPMTLIPEQDAHDAAPAIRPAPEQK